MTYYLLESLNIYSKHIELFLKIHTLLENSLITCKHLDELPTAEQ